MRFLLPSFCLILGAGAVHAQTVDLTEAPLVDSHVRVELALDLAGKITMQQNDKAVVLKQTAQATHVYLERVLEAKDGIALKAGRYYQSAQATIKVEDEVSQRKLNPKHALTLVIRKRADEKPRALSKTAFTREELDLTEHFDSLAVAGLVPGMKVKVGDTWPVAKPVVQALGGFDALETHNLICTLKAVQGSIAHVSVVGSAQGIDVGAKVSLLIEAAYEFDTMAKRITSLTWKQTEQRGAAPANPALAATITYTMKRTVIDAANDVNNNALVPLPDGSSPEHFRLTYKDPQGRFTFQHGRDWLVTSPPGHGQLVMRLLDERGAYLAQATVTPLKKRAGSDKSKDVDAFALEMEQTPGWKQSKEVEKKGDVTHPKNYTVYRVSASGQHLGVACVQSFVYLTRAEGDQALVTFSIPPNQAANLNGRDDDIFRSLVFPEKE